MPLPPVPPEVKLMYDTPLHQGIRINASISALRVIGGWIYSAKIDSAISTNLGIAIGTVFVPEVDLSEIYRV